MIRYIRSCFCKHDFELVKNNEYPGGTTTTYLCKKCGWIRRIRTN